MIIFSQRDATHQRLDNVWTDGLHPGLNAGNQHVVIQGPETHGVIFFHRPARSCRIA